MILCIKYLKTQAIFFLFIDAYINSKRKRGVNIFRKDSKLLQKSGDKSEKGTTAFARTAKGPSVLSLTFFNSEGKVAKY